MSQPSLKSAEQAFVPYSVPRLDAAEAKRRGQLLFEELNGRRSVRQFSDDPVPRDLIELAISAGSTAPSGAHRQPWCFVAVRDPALKRRIRDAAEYEERLNYGGRYPAEWLEVLEPFRTSSEKPYLEVAPWLVAVFAQRYLITDEGRQVNYYVKESVGIACGMFVAALHRMGLSTLPHTPSPMRFLNEILDRPASEQPFALFPVGYPAAQCEVPDLTRKSLDQVAVFK